MREKLQAVIAVIIIAATIAGIAGVVEVTGLRAKWEAQAELNRAARIQEQAELVEQRQQGLVLMPALVAQLTDTALSTTLSIAGWLAFVSLTVYLVVDRRQHAESNRRRTGED